MAKNRELKTRADGVKQHYNTGSSVTSNVDARAAFNPRPAKEEPVPAYDDRGFDEDGIHRETGMLRDAQGFNRDGYDGSGFDRDGYDRDGYTWNGFDRNGKHRDTGEEADNDGFTRELDRPADGTDFNGWYPDGTHEETGTKYNEAGFDRDGYDENGHDYNGFDRNGVHSETGQKYDWDGYDQYELDEDGFGADGLDANHFDREGYDQWGCNRNDVTRYGAPREYVVTLRRARKSHDEIRSLWETGIPVEYALQL